MNGIVHPCSHPEDRPPPTTEEEMMLAIFKYTDRVVNMVRPRKLLLIAVGTFDTFTRKASRNCPPPQARYSIRWDLIVINGVAHLSPIRRVSALEHANI